MNRISYLVIIFLAASFLMIGNFAFAQRPLEINYPDIGGTDPYLLSTVNATVAAKDILPVYIKYVFNFSIFVVASIVFSVLVYNGIRFFFSKGAPSMQNLSRGRIGEAILGLLILLGAYLILTAVNPRLVILSFPELEKFDPALEILKLENKPLKAQAIPLGYLVDKQVKDIEDKGKIEEGIFSETRVFRIEQAYKNINDNAKLLAGIFEKIKSLGEDLKKLTDKCSCGNTSSVVSSCLGGVIGGTCPFSSKSPPSRPYCSGDPCSGDRSAIESLNSQINQKKKEAFAIIYSGAGEKTEIDSALKKLYYPNDEAGLKSLLKAEGDETLIGLVYWQNRLDFEIKDLQESAGELEKARQAIYSCSSQSVRATTIMNSRDFWRYKEEIEKKTGKTIEVENWPNTPLAGPAGDPATFYCVEQDINMASMPVSVPQDLQNAPTLDISLEKIQSPSLNCQEIPIGTVFSSVDSLAKNMTKELQNLFQKTDSVIKSSSSLLAIDDLKQLIGAINSYNCGIGCNVWPETYSWTTWESDEEGNTYPVPHSKTDMCCVISSKSTPKEGRPDDSTQCDNFVPNLICVGTPGISDGKINIPSPQSDITGRTSQLGSYFEPVKSLQKEIEEKIIPAIKNLIEAATKESSKIVGKTETPDDVKKLIGELKTARENLTDSPCSNTSEEWQALLSGSSIVEKGFYTFDMAKAGGWQSEAKNEKSFFCCRSTVAIRK